MTNDHKALAVKLHFLMRLRYFFQATFKNAASRQLLTPYPDKPAARFCFSFIRVCQGFMNDGKKTFALIREKFLLSPCGNYNPESPGMERLLPAGKI